MQFQSLLKKIEIEKGLKSEHGANGVFLNYAISKFLYTLNYAISKFLILKIM